MWEQVGPRAGTSRGPLKVDSEDLIPRKDSKGENRMHHAKMYPS